MSRTAAVLQFTTSGEGAVITSVLDAQRTPLELQSLNDILSDYDEKDALALNSSALPESLKAQVLRTAASFGQGPPPVVPPGPGAQGPPGPAEPPVYSPNNVMPVAAPPPRPTPSVCVPVVPSRDVCLVGPPPYPPCQWFSPTGINEIEVHELKHSFPDLRVVANVDTNDLNSWAYIQLRNTLIDVYRSNVAQKLTLAECRKHCDGDLASLIRLLSFLERHRLINYALENGGAGSLLDPATKKLKEELTNHWTSTPTCSSCDRICLYSFYVLSPSVYGSCLPFSTLRTATWCQDCVRELPNNQSLLKVNLPALHVPGGTVTWSEQQVCALFDAIESLGPDWVGVSKAVSCVPGNPIRTPRECLAAFLSMPLCEQPQLPERQQEEPASSGEPASAEDAQTEKFAIELLMTAMDLLQQRSAELPPVASAISTVASSRLHDIVSSNPGMDNFLA